MGNGELSKSFYPDSPLFSSSEVASKASKSSSSEHKPETIARWYYKCAACWVPRNLYKLEAEARRGSKLARCFLARMHVYDATFIKKDVDKAALLVEGLVPWLQVESAADDSASHIYAVYLLATCYAKGIGVEQNTQTAYQLYSTAALEGYHCAQNALAKCYKQGFGIETDIHQSMKWFSMAAEAGHAEAQYNLAYCYEHGIGVEASNEMALHYYRLSAEQGNAHALYSLGWYLRHHRFKEAKGDREPTNDNGQSNSINSRSKREDFDKSMQLFLIAAEKGLAEAQYIVGLSYDVGNDDDDNDEEEEDANDAVSPPAMSLQTPTKGSSSSSMMQHINESYFLTTPPPPYQTPVKQSIMDAQTANATAVKSMIFSPAEKQRYLPVDSPANLQHISLLPYFSPTHTSTPLLSTTTVQPLPTVTMGNGNNNSTVRGVLPTASSHPPAPPGKEVLLYTSPNPQYQHPHPSNADPTTAATELSSTRFHVRRNPTEAFRWYLMAAEQGHAGAQCNVGYAYMTEEGLPDDLRETYRSRSASMAYYVNEKETTDDDEETQYQRWREAQAVYWYQASAAQEHDEGQYNLGVCYRHGDGGLSVSFAEAMRWFALAAKQGNCKAQYELGKGYRHLHYLYQRLRWRQRQQQQRQQQSPQSQSQPQPPMETLLGMPVGTIDWPNESFIQWQLSAQQGFIPAMIALSESYEYGFGVRKSPQEARKWCLLACGVDETWIQHCQRQKTINIEALQGLEIVATITEEQGEAFFRLACAYLPDLAGDTTTISAGDSATATVGTTQQQPPAPLVKKKSSVALTTASGTHGNTYARRLNVQEASRSVAWTAMWCAAHAGHALARGYVVQQIWEPQVIRPLYQPSSTAAAVSVDLAIDAVEQLWQSYLPLVQEVLHALDTRRRHLSSFDIHSRRAASPVQVMTQWERGERVLFTQLLSSWDAPVTYPWKTSDGSAAGDHEDATTISLVSSWAVEAIESEEEKELLWWFDAMDMTNGMTSPRATSSSSSPSKSTRDVYEVKRDVYAHAAYVIARQCERYLQSGPSNDESTGDDDADANDGAMSLSGDGAEEEDNDALAAVEGRFRDAARAFLASQSLYATTTAGQWSVVYTLYHYAAVTVNHPRAQHRLASLLMEQMVGDRLSLASLYTLATESTETVKETEEGQRASVATFVESLPASAWWQLVLQAAQTQAAQPFTEAPVLLPSLSSTIWELFAWRDALRTLALRWWHPLVTSSSSTISEAPSTYASWIAAYRVGLIYEAWAQEFKTIEEHSAPAPGTLHEENDTHDENDNGVDGNDATAVNSGSTGDDAVPLSLPRFTTTEIEAASSSVIDEETGTTRLWAQYLYQRCVSQTVTVSDANADDSVDDSDDVTRSCALFPHPTATATAAATGTATTPTRSTAGSITLASPPRSPLRRSASSSLVSLTAIGDGPPSIVSAVSPSSASSSVKSTASSSWNLFTRPWTNDGRYVEAVRRIAQRWSRQCQEQSIGFFYYAASGGAISLTHDTHVEPTSLRRGYYLAQYALAWSCEEHLATVIYGGGVVGQERQEAAAVRWYQAVAERASAVIAALHPSSTQIEEGSASSTVDSGVDVSCWRCDDQAEEWLADVFPVDWLVLARPRGTAVSDKATETATESAAIQLWREHWRGRQETVSDACYAIAQAWQGDRGVPTTTTTPNGNCTGGGLHEAIRWYERAIAVAEAASEQPVLAQLQALSTESSTRSGGKPASAAVATQGEGGADADADTDIEPGHAEALYQLGCIYLYGDASQGISQQLRHARCLLEASARCGHEEARQLISLSSVVAT